MPPIKTFSVFGDRVDVIVDKATSNGLSTVMLQLVAPGGGPPPHSHTREDEIFTPLEGNFEFLSDGIWHAVQPGQTVFCPRNNIHTFRNAGAFAGRLLMFITPGGFEEFLEKVGSLSPATDMPRIIEIAASYGITLHL
jgi:quercetin dioxygenase-like cupin family protein